MPVSKIIAVTGYKGGTGKTTTSFHIAAYFSQKGKTLLVDSDVNRAAIRWFERAAKPLVFDVVGEKSAHRKIADAEYVVIDTPARPRSQDLKDIAEGADLIVLPCAPSPLDLIAMVETAQDISGANYRALVSIVPPLPSREGEKMRADLEDSGIPVFNSMIRRSSVFVKAAKDGCSALDFQFERARIAWTDFEMLGKEIEGLLL